MGMMHRSAAGGQLCVGGGPRYSTRVERQESGWLAVACRRGRLRDVRLLQETLATEQDACDAVERAILADVDHQAFPVVLAS